MDQNQEFKEVTKDDDYSLAAHVCVLVFLALIVIAVWAEPLNRWLRVDVFIHSLQKMFD